MLHILVAVYVTSKIVLNLHVAIKIGNVCMCFTPGKNGIYYAEAFSLASSEKLLAVSIFACDPSRA